MNGRIASRSLFPACALALLCLGFAASAQAAGGTAIGWGINGAGQLGNGKSAGAECFCAQAPVSGLSGATQIAVGSGHSLALREDGTVVAWGADGLGQLGDGTTSFEPSLTPIPVPGLAGVVAVAAGARHSLALLGDGTVMAWGENDAAQLGDGSTTGPEDCNGSSCSKAPVKVPGLTDVIAISANTQYSLALLADGRVMAWGAGNTGELPQDPGCDCVLRPTVLPGLSGVMAISAGGSASVALESEGSTKVWGNNRQGEFGNGTLTPDFSSAPVDGPSGVLGVVSGAFFSLAGLPGGGAQGWGANTFGELGVGTPTVGGCECIPAPVPVGGLAGVRALAAGDAHGLALLASGEVEAWGRNAQGQLGGGEGAPRAAPTSVAGVSGASGVFAGAGDSFALVGPSQTLKVSLAGAGKGSVGGPAMLLCPPACDGHYPQGQVEILRAEPARGSGFAGFSGGPCKGTEPCQVKLEGDRSVTATFGPPKGTAITRARINRRRRAATFSFAAPGAITGFQCRLIRPRRHRGPARHAAKRAKPRFARCAGPRTYRHLPPGRYSFEVRALDILGADAKPARRHFKLKARKARR